MTLTILVAVIVGGILGMLILSWLVSFVAFKKFEPVPRAVATVLTAWTIATLLYGFNSGSFLFAGIIYGVGAAVVFWERKRRYEKHWLPDDQLTDTFS
ncbi:hypothetical protein [Sphingopyxis sp. C-1]|jgi:hypothetical protein|uniref:hypothetical protein n=1 Tax=Sphingopyxis sp. C-1 TaxID=262667 RepID=UPI000A9C14EA|nr:hypothetical protein [Sphingopyxis sp. C-1]